jgi:hypothetical protein
MGVIGAVIVAVKLASVTIAVAVGTLLIYRYDFSWYAAIPLAVLAYAAAKMVVALAVGCVWGLKDRRDLKRVLADPMMKDPAIKQDIIDAAPADVRERVATMLNNGMSPYHMKIVFWTNVSVLIYLALAWYVGRLSWPLVGGVCVYWLVLPFAIVWSWPENSAQPLWGRTIIGATLVSLVAWTAFFALAR